jgi:cytochrome c-type biogenesis protein CcmE
MALKKRFNTKTFLYILLVIVIIGAGYIVITNLPPSIDFLNPGEVLQNPQKYLNKEIIVKGYYAKDSADNPIITNKMDEAASGRVTLFFDYSNIVNATDDLREGTVYYFTGSLVLKSQEITQIYEFVAKEFREV